MRSVLQLALFVLLSFPIASLARGHSAPRKSRAINPFCRHTTYPFLCASATGAFIGGHRRPNAEAVLKMHLGAISHRSESASRKAQQLMRRAKPGTFVLLKHCDDLYRAKWDMVGTALRELHARDEQTKQMVHIMTQLLRQSAEECDLSFQQSRIKNPLSRYNRSIVKLAVNCDDLNNMT